MEKEEIIYGPYIPVEAIEVISNGLSINELEELSFHSKMNGSDDNIFNIDTVKQVTNSIIKIK